MKRSELKQIIQEEIHNVLNENDPYEKGMEKFKEKIGFKAPDPSIKNVMKPKEYVVQYWYRQRDDEDLDDVTVMASSEKEAIEKAKKEARRNYIDSSFKVLKVK